VVTVFKIKKGDTVEVITGDERGMRGVIQRVYPDKDRVVVQGVNIVKKHQRRFTSLT
jgi:large subunit ribosomal protein L24